MPTFARPAGQDIGDQDHYSANISLLQHHHPHLWQYLQHNQTLPIGEIFYTPSGKPNLKAVNYEGQSIIFHNSDDLEEATVYRNRLPVEYAGVVTLVGMGLGYPPLDILQHRKRIRHMVIFEPHVGIFLQALTHLDLSPLLTDPRVIIVLGSPPDIEQALGRAGRTVMLEDTHFIRHLASFLFAAPEGCPPKTETYTAMGERVFSCVNHLNMCGSTAVAIGHAHFTNRLKNLRMIKDYRFLESLKNSLPNIPAILVAGGPSLDKNIHLLAQAKGKAVIFAVDTALPALVAHGVIPDFLATMDADEVIYEKISDCAPLVKHVNLLCQNHVAPKIPATFPADQIFLNLGTGHVDNWLRSCFDCEQQDLVSYWSVAHLNLATAILANASPIIFLGQDLAFTDFKGHAAHTVLTDQAIMDNVLANRQDLIWVDGYFDEKVPTNRALQGIKVIFEKMISQHQNLYINATEGGAHIQGTERMPLAEALQRHCALTLHIEDSIRSCVHDAPAPDVTKFCGAATHLLGVIKKLRSALKTSRKILESSQKNVARLKKNATRYTNCSDLPLKLQKELKEIDTLHETIDKATAIWLMLQEVTMKGLQENERFQAQLTGMGSPKEYLDVLELSLTRIEKLNYHQRNALDLFADLLSELVQHFQHEKILAEKAASSPENAEAMFNLASYYMEIGYPAKARFLLENLLERQPERAKIHYYLGCVAVHQRDHEKFHPYFAEANRLDPELQLPIAAFLKQQGDTFKEYAEIYRKFDKNTFIKLLIKGLFFCPSHTAIQKELGNCAREDLSIITKAEEEQKKIDSIIQRWHNLFTTTDSLAACLKKEELVTFHTAYAHLAMRENNFPEAIHWMDEALRLLPTAELHASMMTALFELGQYEQGVIHLQQAVALDNSFGRYWEKIGDSLLESGQYQDALVAYENCFLALPDHLLVLKKIGDCYRSLDQLEAAHASYLQFKERTEATLSTSPGTEV
jgi:Flp pilus assembly protein TadD